MHEAMYKLACLTATYAINALWQVALIAGGGWVASWLLGSVGVRAQHKAWVATLLLSIAMPGVAVIAVAGTWFGFSRGGASAVPVAMVSGGVDVAAHPGALVLPEWLLWTVCALYAGTVLYFAGRLASMVIQTRVLIGDSGRASLGGERQAAWERCRGAFGVDGTVLRTSGQLRGVATAGAIRPVILVPEDFAARCTDRELVSALGHECAHVRRRDALKNLLYEAVGAVTAFHPATWMVKAKVAETREMICDAMVVETLVEAQSYTQSLLRLAERMLTPVTDPIHAIGMFDANVLEKRIMWMRAKKRSVGRATRWSLTVCGALVLGSVAGMGVWLASGVQAQAADHTASNTGKIYRPGGDVTAPVLTYAPDPEFPKAEMKSQGGVCVVGLVVNAHGVPQGVHVVRSLKPDFDANAMAVVRQYRFKPGLHKGQPVAVRINIEVNYRKY